MLTTRQSKQLISRLKDKGVEFDSGLSGKELNLIENKFGFKFPPDLRLFLQEKLPVSNSFINWRQGLIDKQISENIFSRLEWTLEGMLFDLQENEFWVDLWGDKPTTYEEKVQIAKHHYEQYPKLIPIYSHRYIPSEPNEAGNPVFSVHQMDIIYYGYNLASYLANEFNFALPEGFEIPETPKEIEFWSWCVENNF